MSVVADIMATYKGPARVMRKLVSMGQREDRTLAILMFACTVVFVAQWPRLARLSHMSGEELSPMLGGALFGWLFIMPLVMYALATLVFLSLRVVGRKPKAWALRLPLFWALLASSPLLLLYGLVGGFIGEGVPLQIVGAVWLVAFFWFWISGSITAVKETSDGS